MIEKIPSIIIEYILSKIAETFKTTLTTQLAKNQQKYKIHFSAYSTWEI